MKKNRHSWVPIKGSPKRKHAQCMFCQLEKWWDFLFGKLIYQDRYGAIHYKTPSCTHVSDTIKYNKPIVTPYYD